MRLFIFRTLLISAILLEISCKVKDPIPQQNATENIPDSSDLRDIKSDLKVYLKELTSEKFKGRDIVTTEGLDVENYIVNVFKENNLKTIPSLSDYKQWVDFNNPDFELEKNRFKFNLMFYIMFHKGGGSFDSIPNVHNVIGFIEGKNKKEEAIIITAHHDHLGEDLRSKKIYYGANDNASGVSVILALSKYYNKINYKPNRSIVFVTYTAEELGLFGSSYQMKCSPIWNKEKIYANINIDMIGAVDTVYEKNKKSKGYVYSIGGVASPELNTLLISANDKLKKPLKIDGDLDNWTHPSEGIRRSDNYNFLLEGVPSISFFSGFDNFYHTENDTYDKIDFDLMLHRAELIHHFILTLDKSNISITPPVVPKSSFRRGQGVHSYSH